MKTSKHRKRQFKGKDYSSKTGCGYKVQKVNNETIRDMDGSLESMLMGEESWRSLRSDKGYSDEKRGLSQTVASWKMENEAVQGKSKKNIQ